MRLHARPAFAYGNTRLHARRSDLLRGADYERLIGRDVDGLLAALETTPYAPDAEATRAHDGLQRLHDTIRGHLSRSLEEMRSFYADRARELVDVLLGRFDVHNVIAVLRAHARAPHPAEEATVRADRHGLAERAARATRSSARASSPAPSTCSPAPRRTASQAGALRAAFAEYERTEDLAAFEQAVAGDHAARAAAALSAAGPSARSLLRFTRREIDERNLLIALRLRDAPAPGAAVEDSLLAGGSIPPARIAAAVHAAAPTIAETLGRIGDRAWQAPLRQWAAERRPARPRARAPARPDRGGARAVRRGRPALDRRADRLHGRQAQRGAQPPSPRRGERARHPRRHRAARAALAAGALMARLLVLTTEAAGGRLSARRRRGGRGRIPRGGGRAARAAARGRGRRHRPARAVLPRPRRAAAPTAGRAQRPAGRRRSRRARRPRRPKTVANGCSSCSARPSATSSPSATNRGPDDRRSRPSREHHAEGEIWRVAGPVVVARGLPGVRLYNVVRVGDAALPGEVIRLDGERATIQVYEDTAGLRVGEPVRDTGRPLEVELGPGLLGRIFDGTQRPLDVLARDGDDPFGQPLIPRGVDVPALDRDRCVGVRAARRGRHGRRARGPARRRRRDRGARAPDPRSPAPQRDRHGDPQRPGAAGGARRVDRRAARHDAAPPAGTRAGSDRQPARRVDAADHRSAGGRRPVPRRPRRRGRDPRRVRHRQDGAAAGAGEVGARRRRGLRRLRRARQRADRGARGVPRARRSAHRRLADAAHDHDREHLEHAGRRPRGVDLHRDHGGRVLPRPGLSRRADGRLHQPLGRGAARGLQPARGDARRGGLPGLPVDSAGASSTSVPARSAASDRPNAKAR